MDWLHSLAGQLEENKAFGTREGIIPLSGNIYLLPDRNVGGHDNVFEGEVRSSVYGVRPCVIKFAELSEQNVREAEILTRLGSHTNIVAIIQSGIYHDVFEERVYIALDKCHNENLRQYLANRKAAGIEFDLNQAIDFAKQIIVGIMYIHDNNVIHLDLKPSNILISQNLHLIKIADFGLSMIVKSPKSKVFLKHQFGTNGYRPIESFGNSDVSMRSDIFSLGTTLFHLLSNTKDIFCRDDHIFMHNVLNDVTDTSGLLVCNPVTTEHLIKCMVSKERCRRPTIWEVFDHPCWSGEEVDCEFEYFGEESSNDSDANEITSSVEDSKDELPTNLEKDKAFLQRMKDMGFHRESTILVFDHFTKQLHRFDNRDKSMKRMHEYHEGMSSLDFSAISFGEHIYVFKEDRSVYRLEYGDVVASWEKMEDAIGQPGYRPKVVASRKEIFMAGAFCKSRSIKSLSRYHPPIDRWQNTKDRSQEDQTENPKDYPPVDKWERLDDKPTATYGSSFLCTDNFLYCFGGMDLNNTPTNRVDKMDLNTMHWDRVADMIWSPLITSPVQYQENILVIGDHFNAANSLPTTIQMYQSKVDQWTEVTQINGNFLTWVNKTFAIDGILYVVGTEGIHKYDVDNNDWSNVTSYSNHIFVEQFALVKMSK